METLMGENHKKIFYMKDILGTNLLITSFCRNQPIVTLICRHQPTKNTNYLYQFISTNLQEIPIPYVVGTKK